MKKLEQLKQEFAEKWGYTIDLTAPYEYSNYKAIKKLDECLDDLEVLIEKVRQEIIEDKISD